LEVGNRLDYDKTIITGEAAMVLHHGSCTATETRRGLMSIIQILMKRDEMTESEAKAEVAAMREEVLDGADPEDVLFERGLELDYVLEII